MTGGRGDGTGGLCAAFGATLVAAFVAVVVAAHPVPAPQPVGGRADGVLDLPVLRAVDGDTIAIHPHAGAPAAGYLRLWGIDAPELSTEAGRRARDALAGILRDGVRCVAVGSGGYGRMAVRCHAARGNGPDVARLMVEAGLARDCPAFSGGAYRRFESDATAELPPARAACRRDGETEDAR